MKTDAGLIAPMVGVERSVVNAERDSTPMDVD